MPEISAHPSRERLSAYNLGQLPADEAVAIERHIGECEPCCDTIISLSSDDTFVGLLKEARQLPTDQTVDHGLAPASSSDQDVPPQLAEHPRYEILGLIGKGGMGDVYKARHRMMERSVALKIINREFMRNPGAMDRFHREVKAAGQLSHPNIVAAYDAEQAGDIHFMAMEFVEGTDFSQLIKDQGALPIADACEYVRQAAIGLQHAHERGMVHRDIKPHNLMVTSDGTVKVLDFGLASLTPEAISDAVTGEARGDLTAAGAIMGTPDFISPEQAEDARQADIRSDIYSLGATLYYLLSGRVPFAEGSVMHKLKSHAQVEPDSLKNLRNDVPDELVAIVSTMMAKDPDKRYLTPREVADALESFLITWRPGEESPAQVSSSGGNNSGSGGQKPDGEPSPDWLSRWLARWAKWLFYIPFIPIAVLILDVFFLSDPGSDAASDRVLYLYLPITLFLSTLAGALGAAQYLNSKSSNPDDHGIFQWTKGQMLVIGLIIGVAAVLWYIETDNGTIRIKVNDPSIQVSIDGHTITMQDADDTPLTIRPGVNILLVSKDDANFKFHANSFLIRRGDEITFSVGVENGHIVVLKDGESFDRHEIIDIARELQDPDDQPGTASTSTSKPELKITGKTFNQGGAGLPSVYDWNFKGRDVGDLKVRLLLAQNGKTEVVQEFDYEELPADFANKLRLEVKDAARSPKGRRVNAILFVESPVPSRSATVNEDKGLSIDVEAPFSNKIEGADLEPIEPGQAELLLALSYWKGDMTHDLSIGSMTAATKDGNATFLFVTLDWSPVSSGVTASAGAPGTSPNGKPVSECAAIQAALRGYYMDKYPLFAASVNQNSNILSDPSKLREREWLRQIDELGSNSPVSEVIHSFPGKPYVTFTEVTEASGNEVLVMCVNLYRKADETCRVEVTKKQRKKRAGEPVAVGKPITEEEVHKLVRSVTKDSDFKQLQGNWESASVTEGGKQLSTEDGFGGLLLQIKGNTFVIAERKPNGEKSEVDTGRIEIDSTTPPRTIDFIGRAQSTFGIYELKDGVLRICMAETGGNESPPGERIPEVKPAKRPATFDSPTGSNIILMEFRRKQPDVNAEHEARNLLDTTYISNDTVGLLVAHPQRILNPNSKVYEELDQMFAKVAESEGLDVRNLRQFVLQLGPPPLSSRPIENFFDEQILTVILRFDEPVDVKSYIEKHAQGYEKAQHKHETYYRHGSRMEMWFPDNRTLILAAEQRILSLIDDPEGTGPMAMRMRRAGATDDLLLEIDVRQAGPLLLESLPSEAQDPEVYPFIEQTIQSLKRITLTAQHTLYTPIVARFQAIDVERAKELDAQASVLLETAKRGWPQLRELIRERPADKNTKLANELADEIDSLLPKIRLAVEEDQLLVRVAEEGSVDLAALLVFFMLID